MGALDGQVLAALNAQYWHETSNVMRYTVAASAAEYRGLTGLAAWLSAQADGEAIHACKVHSYIKARNESLDPGDVTVDRSSSDLMADILVYVQGVERNTTATLEAIADIAESLGDRMTCQWLLDPDGLIREQVEEENTIQTILDRYAVRAQGGDFVGAIEHDIDCYIKGLL